MLAKNVLTSCALTREAAIAQQALQAALAVLAALRHSQRLLTLLLGGRACAVTSQRQSQPDSHTVVFALFRLLGVAKPGTVLWASRQMTR